MGCWYSESKASTKLKPGVESFIQTVGLAHKIGPLEPLTDGFSRAQYNLPSDVVYSSSGNYYAYSGSVSVVCVNGNFSFTAGSVAGYVMASGYIAYSYDGLVRRAEVSGTPQTSGWTYYSSYTGFANGNYSGWVDALNLYIGSGTCSMYWDVWVDGRLVCKNGHPYDQT